VNTDVIRTALNIPDLPFEQIEVVRMPDGRHVRLTNGRRNRAVGRYASIKMGATMPWESRLELCDLYRAEVDPQVISYSVQPETLHWRSRGKSYRYTPDRLDHLAGGGKRIVEVKDVYDEAADPEYGVKLSEASRIYGALGVAFEIHERASIRMEPSFSAVEEVQAYRRTVVTTADIAEMQRLLQKNSLSLADLLLAMSPNHPRARLFALMTRRIVKIDIARGLHPMATVSLVEGCD